jgi:hypothetical protein
MIKLEPLPSVTGWEMWSVRVCVTNALTWHARPIGSPQAVVHADSVQRLANAAAEWLDRPQSQIDETLEDLRWKLDNTPDKYQHTRNHLTACIETELIALRSRTS